jgi:hypothetical protein
VRCAAVDASNEYFAACGDDKKLKIWKVDGLKLLNERRVDFPVSFTEILIAQKQRAAKETYRNPIHS